MIVIVKNDLDTPINELFPYGLEDGWGDVIACDLNDLIKLKDDIENLLKEVNKNENS